MGNDQKNNGKNPDEPPPLPLRAAQKPVPESAAAGARRSDDEPPPFPPKRVQATSNLPSSSPDSGAAQSQTATAHSGSPQRQPTALPLTPRSIPKSVAIAMTVAVSVPFVISAFAALACLDSSNVDKLLVGARNAMALWLSFLQDGFAVFACVMTLRRTKRYWLPIMASILTVMSWFWLSFTMLPMGLVFVGTVASIGIGMRSFFLFRKPEVQCGFDSQFDPVDWLGHRALPRLPAKIKVKPTPSNISRALVLSLSGLCVVGILIGGALHNHDDRIWKLNEERKEKEKQAQWEAQRQAEEAKRIQEEREEAQSFAEASALWNSGKNAEAVSKYRLLLGNRSGPRKSDYRLVRDRVINFDVEHGNLEEAKNLIADALNGGEQPVLESSKGQELLSGVEAEKAAADKVAAEKAQAEKAAAEKAAAEEAVERAATSGWFRKGNIVFTLPGAIVHGEKEMAAHTSQGLELPAGTKVRICKVELFDGLPLAEIQVLSVPGEMTDTQRRVYVEVGSGYTRKSMLTPE